MRLRRPRSRAAEEVPNSPDPVGAEKEQSLREIWEKSKFRWPLVVVGLLASAVQLAFLAAFFVPGDVPTFLTTCSTREVVVSTEEAGGVSKKETTTETNCTKREPSLSILGIGLGTIALLLLPEIATLVPGLELTIGNNTFKAPGSQFRDLDSNSKTGEAKYLELIESKKSKS